MLNQVQYDVVFLKVDEQQTKTILKQQITNLVY